MSELPGEPAGAGPITSLQRVTELDVLRGVALFGVFLMGLIRFAGPGMMATPEQLAALPTAEIDRWARFAANWLVLDKANTLFAFLFGLGFYIQMQRAEAKGVKFERLYVRRLAILFLIGIANALFLWPGDILHLYALAGLALFALRRLPNWGLIVIGVALALLARIIYVSLIVFGWLEHAPSSFRSVEAILDRQAASAAGDYGVLVQMFAGQNWLEYVANGFIVAWFFYALGRFLVGAWVGRHGWLQRPGDHLQGFRRVMLLTLPAGLVLAFIGAFMETPEFESLGGKWEPIPLVMTAVVVQLLAAPLLATGYLCAIVVALHTSLGRRLLGPFRHVGRMALSNYVAQGLIIGFVLFGIGPGLELAGQIGAVVAWAIVIVAFTVQMVVSRIWLTIFNFGPLEYVWRGLTYRYWPPMLTTHAPPVPAAPTNSPKT